jgi:hypothetical protein
MLLIHPTYTRLIPIDDGIVYIIDHQPQLAQLVARIEADVETGSIYRRQSYNNIEQFILIYGIDVEHVYMEDYLTWKDFPYPYTCVPFYFLEECKHFLTNAALGEYSDEQCCFVMMNKIREHRLLVSAWFNQNKNIDFDYSQGWTSEDRDFSSLEELTRLTHYKLDGFLDKKFIPYKGSSVTSNQSHDGYHAGEGNVAIWNNLFKEQFCSSTFSVITEPPFWENGCMITEKYLMTLYGCCFPIFCGGGYRIADELTNIGFDVFNDVIDHSYQYEEHPGLRVLNALERNRELLENHSFKKLNYMDRHLKNLSLVREHFDSFKLQFSNSQFDRYQSSRNSQFDRYQSSL